MSAERFSALQLLQAMQLGHAVAAVHALGIMDALEQPWEPESLAEHLGLDGALVRGLLDHAARATDLVQRRGRHYRRTRAWNEEARFLVGLYGLAFGSAAAAVGTLLPDPAQAPRFVDQTQHAQVFDAAPPGDEASLAHMLAQLEAHRVLDLGCGPARLFIALAQSDCEFLGWGLEARRPMLARARASVREAGLAKRVRLLHGDARAIRSVVPAAVAAAVDAVVASHLLNELFGAGPSAATALIRTLRDLFPGSWLLVADCAGRLRPKPPPSPAAACCR